MNTGKPSNIGAYFKDISRFKPLTREQVKELGWRKINDEDPEATRKLIEHNLALVVSIALKNIDKGLPLEDLIEEGNIGLIKAVEGYDPAKGFRFSTYATRGIKNYIRKAIKEKSTIIRIPPESMLLYHTRIKPYLIRCKEEDREEDLSEIAREIVSEKASSKLITNAKRRLEDIVRVIENFKPSIEKSDGNSPESIDYLEYKDNSTSRRDDLVKREIELATHRCLEDKRISKRDYEIFMMYNNLGGYKKPRSLESIGRQYDGLTKERVRQICAKVGAEIANDPELSEFYESCYSEAS